MARKPTLPTEGEEMFDKYLAENGLTWSPWPDRNEKNPDRIVHTSAGDVVCEIKDFGENDEYRELIANYKEGKSSAGRGDLSRATGQRIWDALDQLAMVKDERPTMVVLFNPGYLPHELSPFVLETLYGHPQITINIDPGSPHEEHFQYGSDTAGEGRSYNKGLFLKPKLAHVSAVAVLASIKPNKRIYESSLDAHLSEWEKNNPSAKRDSIQYLEAIENHGRAFIEKYGLEFLDLTAIRLKIYHNQNCGRVLDAGSFLGLYDEHLYAY
jgi:hypothetical protein